MSNNSDIIDIQESAPVLNIDLIAAENAAKAFDYEGRDLMFNIDFDFQNDTVMNFVTIDPVLFGTSAFVEVVDISTAANEEDYITVDGFNEQTFDKILTPEANKFVSDDVVNATLAPSNFSYQGLGVFTFPLRLARKIRVTLLMRDPVPNFYERLHVLTQETVTQTVKTTKKKKGLF